jgi:hypothetical protein
MNLNFSIPFQALHKFDISSKPSKMDEAEACCKHGYNPLILRSHQEKLIKSFKEHSQKEVLHDVNACKMEYRLEMI